MLQQHLNIPDQLRNIQQRTKGDRVIWAMVLILALISLLVVYSATGSLAYKMNKGNTGYYLFKQLVFIGIGFMTVYFAHRVNYTIYARVAKIAYFLSIPLLVYTLFFGTNLNEASRWIKLPVINLTFQTSDLAKLSLFMYISHLLSKKQAVIKDFKKGFIPLILPVLLTCALIMPANLSTSLLVGATSMMLLFIGRVSMKHIGLAILIALIPISIIVGVAVSTYEPDEEVVKSSTVVNTMKSKGRFGTWVKRIQNFIYADDKADADDNYQINQAKIAIAKGKWLGLGPGNSEQRNFLPHPYSDFIFAIIIEEYGLLGGVFIMFVYLVFLFRSIQLFRRCPYAFGAFLAVGLSFTLVIQALSNMAVNVNLFPVTGVTLPLVSMGGSSFLFNCLAIGIILSVARNVEQIEGEQSAEADSSVKPTAA